MKIEPVGFISPEYLQNPFDQSVGPDWVPVWNTPHGIATEKVYTESQLRQLGEACAAVADDYEFGNGCKEAILHKIKELLP